MVICLKTIAFRPLTFHKKGLLSRDREREVLLSQNLNNVNNASQTGKINILHESKSTKRKAVVPSRLCSVRILTTRSISNTLWNKYEDCYVQLRERCCKQRSTTAHAIATPTQLFHPEERNVSNVDNVQSRQQRIATHAQPLAQEEKQLHKAQQQTRQKRKVATQTEASTSTSTFPHKQMSKKPSIVTATWHLA